MTMNPTDNWDDEDPGNDKDPTGKDFLSILTMFLAALVAILLILLGITQ